jgi:hypothetical protein
MRLPFTKFGPEKAAKAQLGDIRQQMRPGRYGKVREGRQQAAARFLGTN